RELVRKAAAHGVDGDLVLGRLEADHGDAGAAVRRLRAEYRQRPSAAVADALGWALHRDGEHEEALRYAVRATEGEQGGGVRSALHVFHRGMIERALERYGPARRHMGEALRINPYFSPLRVPEARAALARLGAPSVAAGPESSCAGTASGRVPAAAGARPVRGECRWLSGSQVAPLGLLPLDGLEQGLEVALAEAHGAVPLDEFEEHGRAVLDRLGEDLQQVAVLVPVDEDLQLAERLHRHPGLPGPLAERVVVGVRGVQELHAGRAHLADGLHDVVGVQRDVLDAGAAVELQVLVDLGLLLGDGRLVDRELD